MIDNSVAIGEEIVGRLEAAWNQADGEAFAEPFTEDTDFVDVRGDHHKGRIPVAKGHQAIFDTIYKGSTVKYEAVDSKPLGEGVIYTLGAGTLTSPTGPLAGVAQTHFSVVIVEHSGEWKIAAFHNTLVAPPEVHRPTA